METDETIDCVGAKIENELPEDLIEVTVIATSSIKAGQETAEGKSKPT